MQMTQTTRMKCGRSGVSVFMRGAPFAAHAFVWLTLAAPTFGHAAEPLRGVAAARRADAPVAIAAWSDSALHVGDAEGRAFRSLPMDAIEALALDDDGTMLVVRSPRNGPAAGSVEVVLPDGRPRRVATGSPRAVAAGAGVLAYVDDQGQVQRSDDGGRSWSRVAVPKPCGDCDPALSGSSVDLAIGNGGELVAANVDWSTCTSRDIVEWQRVLRAPRRGAFAQASIVLSPEDDAAVWQVGAFGWAYGVSAAGRLLATSGQATHALWRVRDDRRRLLLAQNGRGTVVLTSDGLLAVEGPKAIALDRNPPASIEALALDVRGRPLAIVSGDLVRFSRASGWQKLVVQRP